MYCSLHFAPLVCEAVNLGKWRVLLGFDHILSGRASAVALHRLSLALRQRGHSFSRWIFLTFLASPNYLQGKFDTTSWSKQQCFCSSLDLARNWVTTNYALWLSLRPNICSSAACSDHSTLLHTTLKSSRKELELTHPFSVGYMILWNILWLAQPCLCPSHSRSTQGCTGVYFKRSCGLSAFWGTRAH